jgi:hypothetical protein
MILSCRSQNHADSVWTDAYQQKIYQQLDDAIKSRLQDQQKRKQLVSYIVTRLKAELPDGLNSVSADSLHRLSVKIGKEYGYAHADGNGDGLTPTARPWTAELEQTLRETFLRGMKKEDLEMGNKLCDCLINKLKKLYPDSVMMPFPHDVALKVASECKKEVTGDSKN